MLNALKQFHEPAKLAVALLPIFFLIITKLLGYIVYDFVTLLHPFFKLKLWFLFFIYFIFVSLFVFRNTSNFLFVIGLFTTLFCSVYFTNNNWAAITWQDKTIYYVEEIDKEGSALLLFKLPIKQVSKPILIEQLPKGHSPILFLKDGYVVLSYVVLDSGNIKEYTIENISQGEP